MSELGWQSRGTDRVAILSEEYHSKKHGVQLDGREDEAGRLVCVYVFWGGHCVDTSAGLLHV